MCFKESDGSFPSGLPRCDISMHAPPSFNTWSMVGFDALILELSATSKLLSRGTLKSTLIRAFLFLKLVSSADFICLKP